MLLRLPIHIFNEYCDFNPEYAEVTLTTADINKIYAMSNLVQEWGIYKTVEFSYLDGIYTEKYDLEWNNDGYEECEEFRQDCSQLNVTAEKINWSGYLKHTDIQWETESLPINRLLTDDELIDIYAEVSK